MQFSLRPANLHMRYSPAGYRCTAVVVALWDWLTAEDVVYGSVCVQACRKPQQILRSSANFYPAYLRYKGLPSARGLSTMSSILGVVRKQLKSHPAVSREHSAFLDCGSDPVTLKALGRTRCGQARARSLKSHLNYVMSSPVIT